MREHLATFPLKILLDLGEWFYEYFIADRVFFHFADQAAQLIAEENYLLDGVEDGRCCEEALVHERAEVLVFVDESDLLEVFGFVYSVLEFDPLCFEDVYLEVLVNIVDQERHVLP